MTGALPASSFEGATLSFGEEGDEATLSFSAPFFFVGGVTVSIAACAADEAGSFGVGARGGAMVVTFGALDEEPFTVGG